jgi:exopolysaccharide biosynthesis polyprenyl glycosylphosphotransferase
MADLRTPIPARAPETSRFGDVPPEVLLHEPRTQAGGSRGRFGRRRHPRWRDSLRRRMLALADVVTFGGAISLGALAGGTELHAVALAMLPLWIILAKLYGLYDNDHRALRHLTADELRELLAWTATGTATYVMLLSLLGQEGTTAADALRIWLFAVLLAPTSRAAARAAWRKIVPRERAVIVGSGALEEATQRKLELFEDIHVECAAVIDDQDVDPAEAALLISGMRAGEGLDRVIVAGSAVTEELIAEKVALCRRLDLKLSLVPPARSMFGTAVHLRHIADLPMIEYSTWDQARSTMAIKRVIDLVLGSLMLLVALPVLVAVAIAVRLTSPGPAMFVQWRAGIGGKPFRVYKFRTMSVDAEQRLADVIDLEQLEHPMFKLTADPRVTPLGRFLRRTSLDELPQLFNVLRGDMSIVGPRPEQLDLVERYAPEHRFRLAVRPGLTGPMQVYGRGRLRFDERLAVEREYVENLSIGRDARMLVLTLAAVVRGRGAF